MNRGNFRPLTSTHEAGSVLSKDRLKEILHPHQMTRPGIAGGKAPKSERPH